MRESKAQPATPPEPPQIPERLEKFVRVILAEYPDDYDDSDAQMMNWLAVKLRDAESALAAERAQTNYWREQCADSWKLRTQERARRERLEALLKDALKVIVPARAPGSDIIEPHGLATRIETALAQTSQEEKP